MKEQNFQNHVRMHPMFHFVVMPLVFITLIGSIIHLFPGPRGGDPLWFAIIELLGAFALIVVALLTRGYANKQSIAHWKPDHLRV